MDRLPYCQRIQRSLQCSIEGVKETRSIGVMEWCRFQYSNAPLLHYSITPGRSTPSLHPAMSEDSAREQMVNHQLAARDVADPRVLEAMRRVPRHRFVPE